MALTSLPFYRKNQSLHDMETERPKNIEALRQAVVKATEEVQVKVKQLEREFNGGKSHEAEIRVIVPATKKLMDVFELTYINSIHDIQQIIDYTLEPSEVFRFDRNAGEIVKDYYRKLVDFMPSKFEDVLDDLERLLKYLKAYCLSFKPVQKNSSKKRNRYLETATHYEAKRVEFIQAIRMHISNIHTMCRDYKERSGVTTKVFGLSTNELARGSDCGEMPLFLIFPEACSNVLNACAGARKWVAEDELYSTYLKHDILKFEETRVQQEQRFRQCTAEGIHINHLIKTVKREIDQLEVDMKKMNKREKQLLAKLDKLHTDIKIMNTEISESERQMAQLPEVAKETPDWTEEDTDKERLRLAAIIANHRVKIPETHHQIEAVKTSQQKMVIDKRELLNNKHSELKQLQNQAIMSQGKVFEAKTELKRVEESLTLLKNIYLKKTSPDVTKKIYNEMPVEPRHGRYVTKRPVRLPHKPDPLDHATKVVARTIKGDWPQLYRSLPFYPPRGEFDKDHDVDKVYSERYRGDDAIRANESIDKWRRVNSLANINSLKQTLTQINRQDIVQQLEQRKKPKQNTKSKKARHHWDRLAKFKSTLNKIMELQARKEEKASDAMETESRPSESEPGELSGTSPMKRVHFATKSHMLRPIKAATRGTPSKRKTGKSGKTWPLPAIKIHTVEA